jgi:hypothetical protein
LSLFLSGVSLHLSCFSPSVSFCLCELQSSSPLTALPPKTEISRLWRYSLYFPCTLLVPLIYFLFVLLCNMLTYTLYRLFKSPCFVKG